MNRDLLEMLRCPACVMSRGGTLRLVREAWLVCGTCGRKFPIIEDVPVTMVEEGDKWMTTGINRLPR